MIGTGVLTIITKRHNTMAGEDGAARMAPRLVVSGMCAASWATDLSTAPGASAGAACVTGHCMPRGTAGLQC
jgi:hypothetical protein